MKVFKNLMGDSATWYTEEEYNKVNEKLETLRSFMLTQCEIYKTHQTEDRICDKCNDADCLLKAIFDIIED